VGYPYVEKISESGQWQQGVSVIPSQPRAEVVQGALRRSVKCYDYWPPPLRWQFLRFQILGNTTFRSYWLYWLLHQLAAHRLEDRASGVMVFAKAGPLQRLACKAPEIPRCEGGSSVKLYLALDEVQEFVRAAEACNNDHWEIFSQHLYKPFRWLWDPWFATFGWCEPGSEQAREMVNSLELRQCTRQLQRFREEGAADIIKTTLREAESFCPPRANAGAFVLLGLGRTDGCVVPTDKGPALFLGIDTYPGRDRLSDLVAHEYNHVVRLGCPELVPERFGEGAGLFGGLTVGDLTVSEGLAVAFPLCLRGEKLTPYAVHDSGLMGRDVAEACLEQEERIQREIYAVWNEPLSKELMVRFFVDGPLRNGEAGGLPPKAGYYLGARLVQRLLEQGWTIRELTTAPTDRFREQDG